MLWNVFCLVVTACFFVGLVFIVRWLFAMLKMLFSYCAEWYAEFMDGNYSQTRREMYRMERAENSYKRRIEELLKENGRLKEELDEARKGKRK